MGKSEKRLTFNFSFMTLQDFFPFQYKCCFLDVGKTTGEEGQYIYKITFYCTEANVEVGSFPLIHFPPGQRKRNGGNSSPFTAHFEIISWSEKTDKNDRRFMAEEQQYT